MPINGILTKRKYETVKNKKFWKRFYWVTCAFGLLLMIFQVFIFRRTIINIYIPISIILIISLLTFYFNKRHFNRTHSSTGNFLPILQNLFSWGFISCYIFMAINYYLADKVTTEYKFEIKEKGSMPDRKFHRHERLPLVTIDYFNFEKELVFRYTDTDKVNDADSVMVIVKKGSLGFDILDDYNVF